MTIRDWRKLSLSLVAAAAALGLLLMIVAARAPHRKPGALFVSDGFGYYIYLPSVIIDGDLDLTNQIAHQPDQQDHEFYRVNPATGLPGNPFQVGCAICWSPFFLAAHALSRGLLALGYNVPADGFGWIYELAVYCGAFFYGCVGLWYIYRLLKELWDQSVAGIATFYIALSSPLAAYLWFEPDMSHALSMALIAALFYYLYRVWTTDDRRWMMWAFLGVLAGLIAAVRIPDGLVVIGVLCVAVSFLRGSSPARSPATWPQALRCGIAFTVAAGLAFLPQLLVWKTLYGSFVQIPSGTNYEHMNWSRPDFVGYLFSTRRGILLWTPVFIPAVVGMLLGAWKGPPILRYALAVLVAAIYFNCSLPMWWAGCSFSERRIVDYSVLFALGLGYLLSLRPALVSRYALHTVGLCLCFFNWVLMVRYFTHELPEYGDVSFNELFVGTVNFVARHLGKLV
jgi:hypothetical protein